MARKEVMGKLRISVDETSSMAPSTMNFSPKNLSPSGRGPRSKTMSPRSAGLLSVPSIPLSPTKSMTLRSTAFEGVRRSLQGLGKK
eukprot:CAMPEP_0184357838 /NCGR_PEP_ID=MMETSP1089-20130417/111075_1 /TAXON_ID=38269 ORGANISM="Gloeochaete wittrockiana, Strain SAG46.84" /NCGR_SAMPLE_ID=MMETSP1089 /ASSEMBLY_ACC=CAM_ASM_000445 /LENGTH=85 /DNA_ID=CAMNT_0026695825 /DNA_START=157 /DNA_END=414 /DNA_ORIENTATION=-